MDEQTASDVREAALEDLELRPEEGDAITGGEGTGKVVLHDISITKPVDKSSPGLLR